MLVIVAFLSSLLPLATASVITSERRDKSMHHITQPSSPSITTSPNLESKRDLDSTLSGMEEVQMVKRVYPQRVNHYHHHRYRRPYSETDRAFIRGPPGAERGVLGRVGATAALGAAEVVGNVIGAVICESAYIWAPALGRCVLRAADCVGAACTRVANGANAVAASVRGGRQALLDRFGNAHIPQIEGPEVTPTGQEAGPTNDPTQADQARANNSPEPRISESSAHRQWELEHQRLWELHNRRKERQAKRTAAAAERSRRTEPRRRVRFDLNQHAGGASPAGKVEPAMHESTDDALRLFGQKIPRQQRPAIGKGKAIMKTPIFKKETSSTGPSDARTRPAANTIDTTRGPRHADFDLNEVPSREGVRDININVLPKVEDQPGQTTPKGRVPQLHRIKSEPIELHRIKSEPLPSSSPISGHRQHERESSARPRRSRRLAPSRG
jgi:hypothetical protein